MHGEKMASPSYRVSSIGILFSPISNCAPVLCLWLPPTPHVYTVSDQAPDSTSLLSFVSDVAVFPDPLLLRDCGFDPFCPSASLSNGWVLAAPRNVCGTALLLIPRDCSWVPACPRKSSRDSIAAVFQGLGTITTHIWHHASPLMTLF